MLKIDDSQLEGSLNNYDGATEEFRQIENNIGSNNFFFSPFLSLKNAVNLEIYSAYLSAS